MPVIQAKSGQTLFDIAIEHCGAIESAFEIAKANNLNVTATLTNGQSLTVPTATKQSQIFIVNHFKTSPNKPATNL
jgi:hypothetical protein